MLLDKQCWPDTDGEKNVIEDTGMCWSPVAVEQKRWAFVCVVNTPLDHTLLWKIQAGKPNALKLQITVTHFKLIKRNILKKQGKTNFESLNPAV